MGTIQPDPVRAILRCNGEEHICKLMPIGWRDQSASWSFSFADFGYGVKYTPDSFRFVNEDADFIRHCLDLYGISAPIDIIIQHRQNNWTYKDTWHGQSRLEDGYVNEVDFFEFKVFEGGLKRAVDKGGKTNFEMPFDNEVVNIQVTEGIVIPNQVIYKSIKGIVHDTRPVANPVEITFGGAIDTSSYVSHPNIVFISDNEPVNNYYMFLRTTKAIVDSTIKIDCSIKVYIDAFMEIFHHDWIQLKIVQFSEDYSQETDFLIFYDEPFDNPMAKIDFNINQNVEFPISNKIYNYALMVSITRRYFQFDDTNVRSGGSQTFMFGGGGTPTFDFKAYRAEKFGQKLINKIYSGATFEVPFLQQMEQNENMQLFITSADEIRGIKATDDQPQGALIKTNFNEFKDNLNALFATGEQCSVKDNFYRIVKKHDIFGNTELLNLGKVKKMQIIQPDDDWLINNIKVGYEKQDYDYPLGRQEFAVTLEFDNQLNVDSKTLDLVSKYRADYTGIHLLHYDYVNSDKKDSKSDNDIFWILAFKKQITNFKNVTGVPGRITDINVSVGQVITNPYQEICHIDDGSSFGVIIIAGTVGVVTEVNISVGQTITANTIIAVIKITTDEWQAIAGDRITAIDGLDGGGYFNILLSPKTMLMNHARFFSSILDKHAKILRYTSSTETMSALEYTDTELGHVVEKADLDVSNAVPFFKPLIFMFNCIVPVSLSEIMGETPCGYFTFEYNNLILKGFPVDVQGSYVNSEQIVKCIAHVDTPDNIQEILHKRLPNKIYK